jgi:hypothetical protein
MHDQIDSFLVILMGLIAAVIGHLFDVPPTTLWVAAIGSALGVAFSKQASLIEAFLLIMFGTLLTGWAVPIILNFAPAIAQKSTAAFLSFTLIAFRAPIKRELPKLLVSVFTRLHQIIRGTTT